MICFFFVTYTRWIVLHVLSHNLVAIIKAAMVLIVVSSPSIITPQKICFLLLSTEMEIDMFYNITLG